MTFSDDFRVFLCWICNERSRRTVMGAVLPCTTIYPKALHGLDDIWHSYAAVKAYTSLHCSRFIMLHAKKVTGIQREFCALQETSTLQQIALQPNARVLTHKGEGFEPSDMSSTTAPLFPADTRPLQAQRDASAAAAGGGSYTPVFVVLGVIAALLVISCLVGQVCTKKHLRHRPRRDRVAYYDDDMEAGGGFDSHGPPHHGGIAKMEAPAAPAVETRATAAGEGAAAVVAQQTAA